MFLNDMEDEPKLTYKQIWNRKNKEKVAAYNKQYYKNSVTLPDLNNKNPVKQIKNNVNTDNNNKNIKLDTEKITKISNAKGPYIEFESTLPSKYIKSINENLFAIYNFNNELFYNNVQYDVMIYKMYEIPITYTGGYIYIVRTQECKNYVPNNCELFKIGMTSDIFLRLCFYGEGVELLFCVKCDEFLSDIENKCLAELRSSCNFVYEKLFGNEYYSGEISDAYELILDVLSTQKHAETDKLLDENEINKIIKLDDQVLFNDTYYNKCVHLDSKYYFYVLKLRLNHSDKFIYKYGITQNLKRETSHKNLITVLLICINIESNVDTFINAFDNLLQNNQTIKIINNKYLICDIDEIFEIIKNIKSTDYNFDHMLSLKNGLWHGIPITQVVKHTNVIKLFSNYNLYKYDILNNKITYLEIAESCKITVKMLFWYLYRIPHNRYTKFISH